MELSLYLMPIVPFSFTFEFLFNFNDDLKMFIVSCDQYFDYQKSNQSMTLPELF